MTPKGAGRRVEWYDRLWPKADMLARDSDVRFRG
jgi:hypothetical protein